MTIFICAHCQAKTAWIDMSDETIDGKPVCIGCVEQMNEDQD
jgi:formylmethanofuran dehydrogenase subunit E